MVGTLPCPLDGHGEVGFTYQVVGMVSLDVDGVVGVQRMVSWVR